MDGLIPIYTQEDGAVWSGGEGRAVLCGSIESALGASRLERTLVVSDDRSILALAKGLGARGVFKEADPDFEVSELLPFGTFAAIEAWKAGSPEKDGRVVVLSFRNPFLSSREINRAVEEYNGTNASTLLSVKPLTDHPCQLEAYYTLAGCGIIHCFESPAVAREYVAKAGLKQGPDGPAQGRRLTKPFDFSWSARGIAWDGVPSLFVRSLGAGNKVKYFPVDKDFVPDGDLISRIFWVCEGPGKARLLLPAKNRDRASSRTVRPPEGFELAGASPADGLGGTAAYAFRSRDRGWRVFFNDAPAPGFLMVLPVDSAGKACMEPVHKRLAGAGKPVFLEIEDEVSGLAYWIMRDIGDGSSHDIQLDFPGEGILWSKDKATGRKINLETGKTITGRQHFPDAFGPEGSIFVLHADGYGLFDAQTSLGKTRGYVMEENSLQVVSELDLLRCYSFGRVGGEKRAMGQNFYCKRPQPGEMDSVAI